MQFKIQKSSQASGPCQMSVFSFNCFHWNFSSELRLITRPGRGPSLGFKSVFLFLSLSQSGDNQFFLSNLRHPIKLAHRPQWVWYTYQISCCEWSWIYKPYIVSWYFSFQAFSPAMYLQYKWHKTCNFIWKFCHWTWRAQRQRDIPEHWHHFHIQLRLLFLCMWARRDKQLSQ